MVKVLPHQRALKGRPPKNNAKRHNKKSDKATPAPKKTGSDKVSGPQSKGLDVWENKEYTAVIKTDKYLTKQKPKHFPFHTGSFTVYNDQVNKQWRIKAYPGSRHTFNIKHTDQWTSVEKKIKQLNHDAQL